MKERDARFLNRVMEDQSGQALVMMSLMLVMLLAFSGFVIDVGHMYFCYQELKASTNSAAMAGAQGLTTSGSQAMTNAAAYSSQTGDKNAYSNLNITNFSAKLGCVGAGPGGSVPCVETVPGDAGSPTANAIQVSQTAKVPDFFMALFGQRSVTLTVTATALMRGGGGLPANIITLLDATESMNTLDTNCGGSLTSLSRFQCMQEGVRSFLETIYPCASSGCGGSANSSGDYPNSIDEVSIFQFPEPENNTQAAKDYTCGDGSPSIVPYTFPSATATSYDPGTGATYQVTPFMSNYQTVGSAGDATTTLSTATGSYVSLAMGAKSGCGMTAPGGEGTYYAGAIYAAIAALQAEQAARLAEGVQTQNVLIIASDGAATARGPSTGRGGFGGGSSQLSTTGLNANGDGIYPSQYDECEQAVVAAQYATSLGIKVFTVAYGSQTTGCTTDTLSGGISSPCQTMQEMASQPSMFYADNNQSGDADTCPSQNNFSSLTDIYTSIAGQLSNARLISNTDFPSS